MFARSIAAEAKRQGEPPPAWKRRRPCERCDSRVGLQCDLCRGLGWVNEPEPREPTPAEWSAIERLVGFWTLTRKYGVAGAAGLYGMPAEEISPEAAAAVQELDAAWDDLEAGHHAEQLRRVKSRREVAGKGPK